MSGELKEVASAISFRLLSIIGELHQRITCGERFSREEHEELLGDLVRINEAVKGMTEIAGNIDELLTTIGAAVKAPTSATEPAPNKEA